MGNVWWKQCNSRLGSLLAATLAVGCLVLPVRADEPAVSSVNGKITGFGGGVGFEGDKGGSAGVAGSLTMPLGRSYGLQLDAAYARVVDGNFGSSGAHLFWRDPTVGLLGIYGGVARLDRFGGQDLVRTGVEAQKFSGQLTLDGALGYRFGTNFVKDTPYARARTQYYLTNDVMLSAGYAYEGRSFGTVGMEYQMSSGGGGGMSLFADAQLGNHDNYSVLGGVRMFLGEDMSLKDRHRRQDPDSYTGVDLSATQTGAGIARKSNQPQSCPFTPLATLCSVASLDLRNLPAKGIKVATALAPARYQQCTSAGYSSNNPGPAACGCAAAFQQCSIPG